MDYDDWDQSNGGNSDEGALMNAVFNQSLRYSNFFLTFSTNVVPANDTELEACVDWLHMVTSDLFGHWHWLNGTVLKPAGTLNHEQHTFPADHLIRDIKSKVAIEVGDFQKGKGQVHAHTLLEVAHEYTRQRHGATGLGHETGRPYLGVHVNVTALRIYLNGRIHEMGLDDGRFPKKIYVNSKLLTKGTDNSNKWLTLQYINKDISRDNGGGNRNLRHDEHDANNDELSRVRNLMLNPMATTNHTIRSNSPEGWRDDDSIGMGGEVDLPPAPIVLNRPAPVAPRMVQVNRPAGPLPPAPSMTQVTSGANVGMKRLGRGQKPPNYK